MIFLMYKVLEPTLSDINLTHSEIADKASKMSLDCASILLCDMKNVVA